MKSPRNVFVWDTTLSRTGSLGNITGVALLVTLLIGISAPTGSSAFRIGIPNIPPNDDGNATPFPLSNSGIHHRNRRSAEGSSTLRSRHVSTHDFKLRLNSDLNHFLHIDNGSIVVGSGQVGNDNLCMRKHRFQVAILDSGEFVVIESSQGGHFLSADASGNLGIQTDEANDVTSVSRTDDRFFRILKQNEGDRFYVLQNVQSGRYLRVENNNLSTVSEEEMEHLGAPVQFEIFNCNVSSG